MGGLPAEVIIGNRSVNGKGTRATAADAGAELPEGPV